MILKHVRKAVVISGHGAEFYVRLSLGGKTQKIAHYCSAPTYYLQHKHIEIFRGLSAYEITLGGRHFGLYLDLFHKQSASPGKIQIVLHIYVRRLTRDITKAFRRKS
jgi:hypothetical protein